MSWIFCLPLYSFLPLFWQKPKDTWRSRTTIKPQNNRLVQSIFFCKGKPVMDLADRPVREQIASFAGIEVTRVVRRGSFPKRRQFLYQIFSGERDCAEGSEENGQYYQSESHCQFRNQICRVASSPFFFGIFRHYSDPQHGILQYEPRRLRVNCSARRRSQERQNSCEGME